MFMDGVKIFIRRTVGPQTSLLEAMKASHENLWAGNVPSIPLIEMGTEYKNPTKVSKILMAPSNWDSFLFAIFYIYHDLSVTLTM